MSSERWKGPPDRFKLCCRNWKSLVTVCCRPRQRTQTHFLLFTRRKVNIVEVLSDNIYDSIFNVGLCFVPLRHMRAMYVRQPTDSLPKCYFRRQGWCPMTFDYYYVPGNLSSSVCLWPATIILEIDEECVGIRALILFRSIWYDNHNMKLSGAAEEFCHNYSYLGNAMFIYIKVY